MPPFHPSIFPFLLPMFGVVSETQDPVVKFCISLLQMPVAVRVCVCTTIQSIHQEAVSYISLFPWKFFVIGFERCGSTDEAHPFTLLPAHTLAHKQPARRWKETAQLCAYAWVWFLSMLVELKACSYYRVVCVCLCV